MVPFTESSITFTHPFHFLPRFPFPRGKKLFNKTLFIRPFLDDDDDDDDDDDNNNNNNNNNLSDFVEISYILMSEYITSMSRPHSTITIVKLIPHIHPDHRNQLHVPYVLVYPTSYPHSQNICRKSYTNKFLCSVFRS